MRVSTLSRSHADALLRFAGEPPRAAVAHALLRTVADLATPTVVVTSLPAAREVRQSARRNSVSGLLHRAVTHGTVELPAPVAEEVRVDAASEAAHTLSLDHAARAMDHNADEHGIELTFLKGIATRQLDHHHRTDRAFVDIDVMVRPADHDRLVALLVADGATVHPRGPIDGPTFFKGSELHTADGIGIDLHTRLFRQSDPDTDGWIEARVLLDDAASSRRAAERPWRLAHAAGHLVYTPIGERKLNAAVDVARLLATGTDLDATLAIARRLGVHAAVAWGLGWVAAAADLPVDRTRLEHDAAAGDLRSRAARAAFLGRRRRLGREQATHLLGLHRRDRPRLVRGSSCRRWCGASVPLGHLPPAALVESEQASPPIGADHLEPGLPTVVVVPPALVDRPGPGPGHQLMNPATDDKGGRGDDTEPPPRDPHRRSRTVEELYRERIGTHPRR
ncbi:MAG: nucleotidyltransferase family protein [Acidimicrobiales bacterium]